MQNLPDATLTQARVEHLHGLVRQLGQHLPFLVKLTTEERKRIYRKGDKQLVYIRQTIRYAKQIPHLVPDYVDVGRMDRDLYLGDQLQSLLEDVAELAGKLEDTKALFYEQAFDAARSVYKSFCNASSTGIHQADEAVNTLKQYFPRTGKPITPKT